MQLSLVFSVVAVALSAGSFVTSIRTATSGGAEGVQPVPDTGYICSTPAAASAENPPSPGEQAISNGSTFSANGLTRYIRSDAPPARTPQKTSVKATGHDHSQLVEIPAYSAPALSPRLLKDPVSGWNLDLGTSNFRFAPEHASTPHVAGEGHAHVYVNGQKLGRFYADWVHLDRLPKGFVTLSVVLASNDHRTLAVAGDPVRAEIKTFVP